MTDLELGPLRFGIIGAGRLGCAVARALQRRGLDVVHASSATAAGRDRAARALGIPLHDDPIAVTSQVDCVLLCVPDDRLDAVVAHLCSRPRDMSPLRLRYVSTSARGPQTLVPLAASGHEVATLHPVASIPRDDDHDQPLSGAGAAIGGEDVAGTVLAHALAHALDMHPFDLDPDAWQLHAAACSMSSTVVAAALGATESLARAMHLHPDASRVIYGRLAAAAAERAQRASGATTLAGPIARGDCHAIAAQVAAVDQLVPEASTLLRAGLAAATSQALCDGHIDVELTHRIEQVLRRSDEPTSTGGR